MSRILFVMPAPPFPLTRGSAQRSELIFRALAASGHTDTALVQPQYERPPKHIDQKRLEDEYNLVGIERLAPRAAVGLARPMRFLNPKTMDRLARGLGSVATEYAVELRLKRWLTRLLDRHQYDLIVVRYPILAARSGAVAQRQVPVILDVDDLPAEMSRQRLQTSRRYGILNALENRRLRGHIRAGQTLFSQCAACWIVSEAHRKEPGLSDARLLPNIPSFSRPTPTGADGTEEVRQSKTLLFIGTFSHNPNVRGLNHFLSRIWPLVLAGCPEAKVRVIGSHMNDQQRRSLMQIPGVEPVGFVQDIAEAYAGTAFSVIPIYEGSGTNIKLAESLAFHRTVVASSFAHRGYGSVLDHEESLLVAEDDEGFAAACLRLLQHTDDRCRLSAYGASQVRTHLSREGFARKVHETIADVETAKMQHPGPLQ